ncbi:hypothetical protein PENSPDRAFT_748928 [Peniophora sp. CONT]|nr:hypothetical protein PENSPDRAFT_748928 [Peniophora sp. CONT]
MFFRRALAPSKALRRTLPIPVSSPHIRFFAAHKHIHPELDEKLHRLQEQVWKASVHDNAPVPPLLRAYNAVRDELQDLSASSRRSILPSTRDSFQADFKDALRLVALSRLDDQEASILKIMVDELTSFGLIEPSEAHSIVLRALAEANKPKVMYQWLTRAISEATTEQWSIYLDLIVLERQSKGTFYQALDAMEEACCPPTLELCTNLLRKVFALSDGAPAIALWAVTAIRSRARPFDTTFREFLLTESAKHFSPHDVAALSAAYPAEHPADDLTDPLVKHANDIADAWRLYGRGAGAGVCQERLHQGFKPTPEALTIILKDKFNIEDVLFWQAQLGVKAEPVVWAQLLSTEAERSKDDPFAALAVFYRAQDAGVDLSFTVADVVLRIMCTADHGTIAPSEELTRSAYGVYLDVYNWYCRDLKEGQSPPRDVCLVPPGQETVAATSVFDTLNRVLTLAPATWPLALRQLKHVRRLRLPLDGPAFIDWVTRLIRTAPNAFQAREVYIIARTFGQSALDGPGCAAVLHALLLVRGGGNALPLWREYLFVLERMRQDGAVLPEDVHVELLDCLAAVGSSLPRRLNTEDAVAVQASLAYALDAVRTSMGTSAGGARPSAASRHALLRALVAARCHDAAVRTWHQMLVVGDADVDSVAAILPACLSANAARGVVARAQCDGIVLDLPAWNAFLRTLVRLNAVSDARKHLVEYMGKNEDAVQPDDESATIVLSGVFERSGLLAALKEARQIIDAWPSFEAVAKDLLLESAHSDVRAAMNDGLLAAMDKADTIVEAWPALEGDALSVRQECAIADLRAVMEEGGLPAAMDRANAIAKAWPALKPGVLDFLRTGGRRPIATATKHQEEAHVEDAAHLTSSVVLEG